MKKILLKLILLSIIFPSLALGARPLSTDDAGTVEKRHAEVESGFEYANKTNNEYNWSASLKYGLAEKWDFGVETPYQFIDVADGDDVDGIGDVVVTSKYRLLEESECLPALALSFKIKTKTGNKDKDLGTGALDYAINSILSRELDKIATHLNLGYTRVGGPEGTKDDDVFSYAVALEYPFSDRLNLVGEVTGETNFEGDFNDNQFAVLTGIGYVFSERTTFDFGIGWGISDASADYKIISGITLGF